MPTNCLLLVYYYYDHYILNVPLCTHSNSILEFPPLLSFTVPSVILFQATPFPPCRSRLIKETHFWDNLYLSGEDVQLYNQGWEVRMPKLSKLSYFRSGVKPILFEATPSYLRYPYVACRMKKLWPGVRLVFILR